MKDDHEMVCNFFKSTKLSKFELFVIMNLAIHWFTDDDVEIPVDLKIMMRTYVKETLGSYEKYLIRNRFSIDAAKFRACQMLEFVKMVCFHGETGMKTLMSCNNLVLMNSFLNISDTVAAM